MATYSDALSWATRLASGFSDEDLRLFDDILPAFSAIAEIKSLRRFATNMLHTNAGREPGELRRAKSDAVIFGPLRQR